MQRTAVPQLTDALSQLVGTEHEGDREYITSFEIKSSPWMASAHQGPYLDRQIAQAMRFNGWSRDKTNNAKDGRGFHVRRYWRVVE